MPQEEETPTTNTNIKTTISRTPPQSIQPQHNLQPNHRFNNTKLQTTIRFLLRPQHPHMEKHQNNNCQHKQNRLLQSSEQQHLPQPMHTHQTTPRTWLDTWTRTKILCPNQEP